jgi:hypothetical protein
MNAPYKVAKASMSRLHVVFRKGSKRAKLAVMTGEGYPTLALNHQLMWLAATSRNRKRITVHDLGSAKEIAKITTTGTRRLATRARVTREQLPGSRSHTYLCACAVTVTQ